MMTLEISSLEEGKKGELCPPKNIHHSNMLLISLNKFSKLDSVFSSIVLGGFELNVEATR